MVDRARSVHELLIETMGGMRLIQMSRESHIRDLITRT